METKLKWYTVILIMAAYERQIFMVHVSVWWRYCRANDTHSICIVYQVAPEQCIESCWDRARVLVNVHIKHGYRFTNYTMRQFLHTEFLQRQPKLKDKFAVLFTNYKSSSSVRWESDLLLTQISFWLWLAGYGALTCVQVNHADHTHDHISQSNQTLGVKRVRAWWAQTYGRV